MLELGLGDDDANIESDFLVWKKKFGNAVCKAFNLPPPTRSNFAVKRKQYIITYKPDDVNVQHTDVDNIPRYTPTRGFSDVRFSYET